MELNFHWFDVLKIDYADSMLDDLQQSITPQQQRSVTSQHHQQHSRSAKSSTSSSTNSSAVHQQHSVQQQHQQHSVARRLFPEDDDSSINTSPGVTPSSLKAANQSAAPVIFSRFSLLFLPLDGSAYVSGNAATSINV